MKSTRIGISKKLDKETIKVVIAEDKPLLRTDLKEYLHTEKDIRVIFEAENGSQLIECLNNCKPDIILTDIQMPVMNGVEASRLILKDDPTAKIIAWTIFEDEEHLITMSRLGVKSYLGKSNYDEILKAIRIVNSGGVYLPDKFAGILSSYLEKESSKKNCPIKLSPFEYSLVKAIGKGYSSTEIGNLIGKSHRTVEDYRNDLYKKFNVNNKEELIIKATMWNML